MLCGGVAILGCSSLLPPVRRKLQRMLKTSPSIPGASSRNGTTSRRWVRMLRVVACGNWGSTPSLARGGGVHSASPVSVVCLGAQYGRLVELLGNRG
jgi:hypothetical protein